MMLSQQEVARRLHLFNLSVPRDWSLFDGVDPLQQVCFMYPEVLMPYGTTVESIVWSIGPGVVIWI